MHHVMFDVDGTLVQSENLDGSLYRDAIHRVTGKPLNNEWTHFEHVTDAGIFIQHISENGISDSRESSLMEEVRRVFTQSVKNELKINAVKEICGAGRFIQELRQLDGLSISLATGGWKETALMKLESAKIEISGIPIASSDDHYARVEIMKRAKNMACGKKAVACTYFGDGEWDKKACDELGYNFIQVGEVMFHHQVIASFWDMEMAKKYIGL